MGISYCFFDINVLSILQIYHTKVIPCFSIFVLPIYCIPTMQGKKVKFYKTAALVNELTDAKSDGSLTKLLKRLSKLDLLICDEWGYLPFDAEGSQLLFQVIADCYEKRSLILTTNIVL